MQHPTKALSNITAKILQVKVFALGKENHISLQHINSGVSSCYGDRARANKDDQLVRPIPSYIVTLDMYYYSTIEPACTMTCVKYLRTARILRPTLERFVAFLHSLKNGLRSDSESQNINIFLGERAPSHPSPYQ